MNAENQNFYINIGHAMWQWRTDYNLTIHDVARRMHIDVAQYCAMERGQIELTAQEFLCFLFAMCDLCQSRRGPIRQHRRPRRPS